ncbi:twin-arginine translocase subunit TatC [Methylogaea oryzae]|uniref:Sec-independent protein translocase protein TatC n=1 Tax=Methylogaea oryzae TaxID=1295382 RepID=A0A8D4VLW7_9GAMM|nr:twin-arginine translocase subunit TatC [Methylogaea oryzae]BBL69527.1 Sec-independent protein translocase protein TatC [Methylogaea oryzae]
MPQEELEQPFIAHLVELRDRLLKAALMILLVFAALTFVANDLYSYLAGPLLSHMPAGSQMIATDVASPFLAPLKLALVAAIFITMPFSLYQAWAFVAPGLYGHEKRLLAPLLLASTVLFYTGMAFAYYVVFPVIFAFLTATAPVGVAVMTDIGKYMDFVLTLFFAFGAAFEVPIVALLLVWSGLVTAQGLAEKRPYVIVAAFVIGAVLTPPDVVSQTLLAVPMWLLFEAGLLAARWLPGRGSEVKAP